MSVGAWAKIRVARHILKWNAKLLLSAVPENGEFR